MICMLSMKNAELLRYVITEFEYVNDHNDGLIMRLFKYENNCSSSLLSKKVKDIA